MRFITSFATAVFLLTAIPFQPLLGQQSTIYDEPLSERRVSYAIDAELDPDTRTVTATQRMTW